MRDLLRRLRGAIGMGLTWAIGWALVGIGIGAASVLLPFLPWQAFFNVFDAPLPALAVPGFIGGVMFSLVLGIAGRNRRFDQLSLAQVGAWGGVGGLLLSLLPAAMLMGEAATLSPGARLNVLQLTLVISVPLIILSAASAMATLWLAQAGSGPRQGSLPRDGGQHRLSPTSFLRVQPSDREARRAGTN